MANIGEPQRKVSTKTIYRAEIITWEIGLNDEGEEVASNVLMEEGFYQSNDEGNVLILADRVFKIAQLITGLVEWEGEV